MNVDEGKGKVEELGSFGNEPMEGKQGRSFGME